MPPTRCAATSTIASTTSRATPRWALTRPFGDELLFVGSGGTFEYASLDGARSGLHLELIRLIRNQASALREPGKAHLSPLRRVRRALRNLLGPRAPDLYDLMAWTVFEPDAAERPKPAPQERRAPARTGRPSAVQRGPRVAGVAAAKAR